MRIKTLISNGVPIIFFIIFTSIIFVLSIKGHYGNPSTTELNTKKWIENGPFELSPERGRFALTYSLIEDNSFFFSLPIAKFATPDLGFANGKFVSLFAPAVSFVVIPGYLIGKSLGISQVGTFAVISLFGLFNGILIILISKTLGANLKSGIIGGLVFLFASPAFSYAVTLYQHHISTFLILMTLYLFIRYKSFISLALIWLLFAASIPVDYPNIFLMLPIILYASAQIFSLKLKASSLTFKFNYLNFFTPIVVILPLFFYIWFSQNSYSKPFQLSGTVDSISALDSNGKPTETTDLITKSVDQMRKDTGEKKAVGFFKTRNLLNGFYIHIFSPDRGVLNYTPIILLGVSGFFVLWRKKQSILAIMVGIAGINIIIYSLWGDPWGGWAFGSRYLIPTYAILSILISLGLARFGKNIAFIIIFAILTVYSVWVNTLGALTTNTNPPQVQVLELEQITKEVQKYTFERNWDYLQLHGLKAYSYNTYFSNYLNAKTYFLLISGSIIFVILFLTIINYQNYGKKR